MMVDRKDDWDEIDKLKARNDELVRDISYASDINKILCEALEKIASDEIENEVVYTDISEQMQYIAQQALEKTEK